MSENERTIDLYTIAGGALDEKLEAAMQKVLENLQDPNVPYKPKRTVTIQIDFQQNEHRDSTVVDLKVSTKLPPVANISTQFALGIDLDAGKIVAKEYQRGGYPNQITVDQLRASADPETGELPETTGIIDLRQAKANQ